MLARLADLRLTLLRFERASDAIVRRCGITPRQHLLLLTLEGRHEGTASIGTLSEDLGLAQSTVTELADRSETKGIVRRESWRQDGRVVLVRTTDEGRRLLALVLAQLDVERELLGAALDRIAAVLPASGAARKGTKRAG
ncbi:MAG TPA: MarR family transcriptional regulator [Gaiella sp.]|nr:MarR family transcriptional regulator [Gaiella sp.]